MMIRLRYIPKDRKINRRQWKELDRWVRLVSKVVDKEVQKNLTDIAVYGSTII